MKNSERLLLIDGGVIQVTPTVKALVDKLLAGEEIQPNYSTGAKYNYSCLHEYRNEIKDILKKMNIEFDEYSISNRAIPGKTSWRICLKKPLPV